MWRVIGLLLAGVLGISSAWGVTVDPNLGKYKVYQADLNTDGKLDYYFQGIPLIILLHGDVATPIVLPAPASFVVYSQGSGFLLPMEESYTESQLATKNLVASSATPSALQTIIANATIDPNSNPGSIASPVTPQIAVAPVPASTIDATRALPAEFDVTNNGQATYKIPVITAPGSAGLVPNVSLNYSSGAGNGNMGLGWSLSAYGVISRCRQTEGIDGVAKPITWTSEDRFCLNGDRLLLASGSYGASGSTYKTEIDSFARITAVGGVAGHPDYFTVEYKDGIIETYGNTTDSYYSKNQLSSGNANTVLDWALSKRSDSAGNKIVFNYINDVDGQRIDTIDYAFGAGSTRGAFLKFIYEDRSDPIKHYIEGEQYSLSKKLVGVKSYRGNTESEINELRHYIVEYDQGSAAVLTDVISRVSSVRECVASVCGPKTNFEWMVPNLGFSVAKDGFYSFGVGVGSYQQADINGDNISDLVWLETSAPSNGRDKQRYLRYALGSLDSTGKLIWNDTNFADGKAKIALGFADSLNVIDVNGDGRKDVVVGIDVRNNVSSNVIYIGQDYMPTANAFYSEVPRITSAHVFISKPMGDKTWALSYLSHVTLNDQTGFNMVFGDVNSDGLADIIDWPGDNFGVDQWGNLISPSYKKGYLRPLQKRDAEFFDSNSFYKFGQEPIGHTVSSEPIYDDGLTRTVYPLEKAPIRGVLPAYGDFNGDGRVDFIAVVTAAINCGWKGDDSPDRVCTTEDQLSPYISTSNISNSKSINLKYFVGPQIGTSQLVHVVDLNNDGLSDIVWGYNQHWQFTLSNGTSFTTSQLFKAPGNSDHTQVQFADYNRDGYLDAMWADVNGAPNAYLMVKYWNPSINNFGNAEQVTSLTIDVLSSYYDPVRGVLINQPYPTSRVEIADHNGDGVDDLVVASNIRQGSYSVYLGIKNTQGTEGYISTITDGLGMKRSIKYEKITNSTHYSGLGTSGLALTPSIEKSCEYTWTGNSAHLAVLGCSDISVTALDSKSLYKAINDPWHYLPSDEQSLGSASPVLEVSSPMSVVTSVEVTAPGGNKLSPDYIDTISTSKLNYYYRHAKMQAGGRGFLGFKYFTVVNQETDIRTETEYRQDWPYIGQPRKIKTFTASGHKLSEQENTWGLVNCHDSSGNPNSSCVTSMSAQVDASGSGVLGALQPFLRKSVTHTYALKDNGISQGDLVSTSTESTVYDNKGNAVRSESIVTSPLGLPTLNKTTINTYDYSGSTWSMQQGRLQRMTVAANEPTYGTVTRTSSFTYYTSGADIGLLNTETVEPDNSAFTVTTTHYYNKGNRYKSVTTADGQTRQTEVEYDSLGRYVDKTYGFFTNGTAPDTPVRQLVSQVVSRDKYGTPTEVRNYVSASGYVTKKVVTTAFGTPYFTADSTGAFVEVKMGSGIDANNICPSDNKIWITTRSAGGAMNIECKDILGRTRRTGSIGFDGSDWSLVDKEYDKLGRVLHTSSPYWRNSNERYWTSQSYDILGRVTATKTPYKNSYVTTTTSYTNLEVRITNPKNQVRIEKRDLAGQVYEVVDPNNGVTKFAYDARGNMREMRDPASNITAIGYDLRDRKTSMNDPDKGSWIYKYNRFGDLICQMDGSGQISVQRYDIAGRMFSRTDRAAGGNCDNPTGTVDKYSQWTYDTAANGLGQLASVHDSASVSGAVQFQQTYSYDNLGRVSGTTTTMPGHGGLVGSHYEKITYDQFGRVFQTFDAARTGASFATNGIQNVYNSYGYLNKVVDAVSYNGVQQAYYTVNQINARGNITSANYGNGVTQLADYYPESGLTKRLRANRALASLPIQDLELEWDEVGNLGWRQETGTASDSVRRNIRENFTYDSLNRLRTWTTSGDLAASETANYNNIDNITDKTGIGNYLYGTQCGSGTNAGPHALCRAGTTNYFYDKNGNMLNDSAGRTMKYTTYDLPKEITKGGHKTEFSYGPNRARYKRVDTSSTNQVTTSLYLGSVEKVYYWDGSIQWKRNIAGVAQITQTVNNSGTKLGEAQRYFIKDHLGSIGLITDEIGAAEQTNFFDPWGRERKIVTSGSIKQWLANNDNYRIASKPITTRGFTGHEQLAEVGLIHMNGRIYDGTLGRFVQADPIIQDPLRVQSLNRYSYVWNNPLNATDPTGFMLVNISYWGEDGIDFLFADWNVSHKSAKRMLGEKAGKDKSGVSANSYSSEGGSKKTNPEVEKLWNELVQAAKNSVAEKSSEAHTEASDTAVPKGAAPISDYADSMGEDYNRYARELHRSGKEAAETGATFTEAVVPLGGISKKAKAAEKIVEILRKEDKVTDSLNVTSEAVTNSAFSKVAPATEKQLQKKFKHAEDFGVTGNYNPANAKKFNQAIQDHLNAPGTKEISGTYRGNPATFHTDPTTGLTVIQNPNGSFLSGWKLNPQQLHHVLKDGKL